MSADNGVYILKNTKADKNGFEYRVVHAQAIENIFVNVNKYIPDAKMIKLYFDKAVVYDDKDEAQIEADILAEEEPVLEYGICNLICWSHLTYATICRGLTSEEI